MESNTDRRHRRTLKFMEKHLGKDDTILDLGVRNRLSDKMRDNGYDVRNTPQDLDTIFGEAQFYNVITAFEIFEHMFAPFNILNASSGKLIASVPLKQWFCDAYWNYDDPRDCHYHEFEIKQFNHLLSRTEWTIKDFEVWTDPHRRIGLRPILRLFSPRYYIIYAEK